jgi:hypothetical protein
VRFKGILVAHGEFFLEVALVSMEQDRIGEERAMRSPAFFVDDIVDRRDLRARWFIPLTK